MDLLGFAMCCPSAHVLDCILQIASHSPPTCEVSSSNCGPYVGKAGSCLPMVISLQYRTLTSYMYWSPYVYKTTHRDMTCTVLKATEPPPPPKKKKINK